MVVNEYNVVFLDNVTFLYNESKITSMKFGERFKQWRKSKGVSNYKIEALTGISRANLSHMEKGKYIPSDEALEKIAAIPELELTMGQLLKWKVEERFPRAFSGEGREIVVSADNDTYDQVIGFAKESELSLEDAAIVLVAEGIFDKEKQILAQARHILAKQTPEVAAILERTLVDPVYRQEAIRLLREMGVQE